MKNRGIWVVWKRQGFSWGDCNKNQSRERKGQERFHLKKEETIAKT